MSQLKKKPFVRKALNLRLQVPRIGRRLTANATKYKKYPPILSNSFPKSGTHLLLQILSSFPDISFFGSFIASTPTLTFRELPVQVHLRLINRIAPGELVPGHLFFSNKFSTALQKKNCIQYFIYRDPRDVAVSEAHYLTHMNRWHRMHAYYAKSLNTLEERITTAILGVNDSDFPYDYPNISERFQRYAGWLNISEVCPVKFEEIMSENRTETLKKLLFHYQIQSQATFDYPETLRKMETNITPTKSHTFRQGKIGGWKDVFTSEHKAQMKSVAGDLLISLGYEQDNNW